MLIAFLSLPWWLYLAFAVLITGPIIQRLIEEALLERKFARAGLSDVRSMHWREFEQYLAHLFRAQGYHVELGPGTGDFGVDLILTENNGRQTAVQAKHWRRKRVGSPDVNKTVGGAVGYGCEKVMIVTTSGYTDAAREAARRTGCYFVAAKKLPIAKTYHFGYESVVQ